MILIAAVNNSWGIGKDNGLLYRISADMKFFREKTKGNIIVIGRKTLESFPNGEPLKYRENLVLTQNTSYRKDGALIFHGVDEILKYLKEHSDKEAYLCGGEQIYSLLLPYCSTALITKIDDDKEADRFIPNLDKADGWVLTQQSDTFTENGYNFRFLTYTNSCPLAY